MPEARSAIVMFPEKEDPLCVSTQVICPSPDESEADPAHVPFTFAGVGEGVAGPSLLFEQAAPARTLASASMRPTREALREDHGISEIAG